MYYTGWAIENEANAIPEAIVTFPKNDETGQFWIEGKNF